MPTKSKTLAVANLRYRESLTSMLCSLLLAATAGAQVTLQHELKSTGTGEPAHTSTMRHNQFGHSQGWRIPTEAARAKNLSVVWSAELGQGRSQIVGDQDTIIVTCGDEPKVESTSRTRVCALSTSTGEELWQWSEEAKLRGNQQTFGGAYPSPQATPLLTAEEVVVLSFTGELICLDRRTGNVRWQIDLVESYKAAPVQFGFSASPIADPEDGNAMLVMAAGDEGGLLNLRISDGKLNWRSPCKTASYSTPVAANFGGQRQWVITSESGVQGINANDGQTLWNYPFPETGLTNVPTPLVVNDKLLVISGQGCQGTRCIKISQQARDWKISEKWASKRLQFFYTNWLIDEQQTLWGCTSDYLAAIDLKDGSTLSRIRGFGDGNLLRSQEQLLILGSKGQISSLQIRSINERVSNKTADREIEIQRQYQTPAGRCWTVPTLIADCIIIRSKSEVHCLSWKANTGNKLANTLKQPRNYLIERSQRANKPDPVEQIFAVFRSAGQARALKTYTALREQGQLDLPARVALVMAARQQGLNDVAEGILDQAIKDFPNSTELQDLQK